MPTVRHAPQVRSNAWEDVADVARAYGLVLDEWQENVLQAAMGERSDGQWASPRVGLSVPRQNGKGALIEARELAGLLVFGEQSIVHSAHEQRTARVGFDRLRAYFENYDDLGRKVKAIGTAVAREYIELKSGQMLRFPARSRGAIRGFSIDCLILDEAQIFSDLALQAVMPTLAARPNPQMWLLGTPPTPADDGEVFGRWRQLGHTGEDRRLAWCEWSADPDCDMDDREAWVQANPALGIRIGYESIQDERAALSDDGFARERLGIWDSIGARQVIDTDSWASVADMDSRPTERLVLAVDVDPDQSRAAVSLAGMRADGLAHVELYEQRQGVGWVVPWIVDRWQLGSVSAVVIDGKSPAAALVDELKRRRVRGVTVTDHNDMADACAWFYQAVMERTMRHTGQPQLDAALAGASKRTLGDRWAWNRKTAAADITPLVAATLALWGVQTSKVRRRDPGKQRRVVVLQ